MGKRALDKSYEEIEAKYKNMSEEDMKKEIENLEKEVAGKTVSTYQLKDEQKENAEKSIKKLEQKLENLKGYSKNKNQISKIIDFKGQLETKLANTINAKKDSKKAYEDAKKDYIEASKILKDEKQTMQMDQNEYNELLNKKDYAEKEMKKQQEIFEKAKSKEQDIKSKIGKCDLAWRTLFTNKTWDDIQLRATQTKGKFTRNISEEEKLDKISEQGKESRSKEEQEIQEQIAKNVNEIMDEEKNSNLPAKVNAWTKFKNFFRSIPAKLKATFGKEEITTNVITSKNSFTKEPKDEFLEALRQNVDVDYREAVRKAKEQQYINEHKAKSQNENQK